MPLSPHDLAELSSKYEEMLRLREAHLAPDEPDPRAAMADLAARFPGALREIDEIAMAELRARVDALRVAAEDASRVEAWMEPISAFHRLARGALAAKRWLAGRRAADEGTRRAFEEACATLRFGDDARRWSAKLEEIARPPGGRILPLVFVELAEALGVTSVEDVKALVLVRAKRR